MNENVFRRRYERLRRMLDLKLAGLVREGEPEELREACRYVLSGGGKRIRGVIVLLSCEAVGATAAKALHAAAAIEVLHNFTLVHDDVMDNSPLRRGRPTVHVRWNMNTALLAGDVLVGLGYRTLLTRDHRRTELLTRTFTACLLNVCEGQALDLAFGRRSDVTVPEYFAMIGKKTASLIAGAAEIGGISGGATSRERAALRRYGMHLGRAFQLQDDLLDVVGTPRNIGKQIGGDIVERKRTYLLLRACELASGADRELLLGLARIDGERPEASMTTVHRGPEAASPRQNLIEDVAAAYKRTGVLEETREVIRLSTAQAIRALRPLRATRSRDMLSRLAESLVQRQS